jgi:hypothetical protein
MYWLSKLILSILITNTSNPPKPTPMNQLTFALVLFLVFSVASCEPGPKTESPKKSTVALTEPSLLEKIKESRDLAVNLLNSTLENHSELLPEEKLQLKSIMRGLTLDSIIEAPKGSELTVSTMSIVITDNLAPGHIMAFDHHLFETRSILVMYVDKERCKNKDIESLALNLIHEKTHELQWISHHGRDMTMTWKERELDAWKWTALCARLFWNLPVYNGPCPKNQAEINHVIESYDHQGFSLAQSEYITISDRGNCREDIIDILYGQFEGWEE